MNQGETLAGLDYIERMLRRWVEFNVEQRTSEGLSSDDDTFIITPPTWPTHGAVRQWIKTVQSAKAFVEGAD